MRAKKVRMRARARMGACVRLCHPSLYLKPPAFVAPFASRTNDLPQGNALTAPQDCRNCDALPTPYSDSHYFQPTSSALTNERVRSRTHIHRHIHWRLSSANGLVDGKRTRPSVGPLTDTMGRGPAPAVNGPLTAHGRIRPLTVNGWRNLGAGGAGT
jgi:hypothetical protein